MISHHVGYIHLAVSDICLTTSDIRLTASHGIHLYVAIFLNEEHKVYSRNLGEASHASVYKSVHEGQKTRKSAQKTQKKQFVGSGIGALISCENRA